MLLRVLITYYPSLPSFVKDTNDALRECDNFTFPHNTPHDERHLFTMDVTSLYTNIPHGEGLVALKHFLPKVLIGRRVSCQAYY